MCCSLTYKEGPRTIVINGFPTVRAATKHAENNCIDSYLLKVQPGE